MNADLAFQNAANLAAASAATPPAYISYTTHTHIAIPSMHRERDVNRSEVTRTSDGVTYMADLPRGAKRFEKEAFPLPPTFNAISAFNLQYGMSLNGKPSFHLSNVQALTYHRMDASDADVVVVSTRGYRVKFADDSSDDPHGTRHLLLTPTHTAKNTYYFSEMFIDNTSGLPTRISYNGSNDFHMSFTYSTMNGRWIITTAHLESTLFGPLGIGRVHFIADTTFSDIAFSQTSPLAH